MRNCLSLALLTFLIFSVAIAHAAPKAKAKAVDPATAAASATVDQTIQDIFKSANTNHNDVLSKTEFRKAQAMLDDAAMGLAQQGVIGKPQAKGGKKNTASSAVPPGAGSMDLSKNNKITLAEFTLYAQAYLQNADAVVSQARAAYDARQKARNSRYPIRTSR